ncbi:hypothetical protein PQQ84_31865 [Paraburkholderia strydomiana]|jgi:hypothetical protein|uniref:hypothetical protein n=1 Tax=Paraburkholderia strydomiana TaxID=1245417 RepID=UPI0038B9A737
MSIQIPSGDRSWVIRRTLSFDSATHTFGRRDVEIAGKRIRAVLPAGTSTLADGVDGEPFVCTPGIVGVEALRDDPVPSGVESLPSCMTTVGVYWANTRDTRRWLATSARTVALLKFDGSNLEQVNGLLDWSLTAARGRAGVCAASDRAPARPINVLPVLASGRLMSATEIVEVARLAKILGTRIGIRLSTTADEALEFRSRFYCSEIALIAYLLPQEQAVTIFDAARIDRREASVLARTLCTVSFGEPDADGFAGRWRNHAPLFMQRRAALHVSRESVRPLLTRVVKDAPAAQLDCYADALTRSAAGALGLTDVGALAPGMKADLCMFERDDPHAADYSTGSAAFLSLLASRSPVLTLVEGRPMPAGLHAGTVDRPLLASGWA